MLKQKEENCFDFWLIGYNYKHKMKLMMFMAIKLKWLALFPADNISASAHLFTTGRLSLPILTLLSPALHKYSSSAHLVLTDCSCRESLA